MAKIQWVLNAYCKKHGILTKGEDGSAYCPDCGDSAEDAENYRAPSPKAEPKTEGMTDAEIDAVEAQFGWSGPEGYAFKKVCAQAKRCNALERERDEERRLHGEAVRAHDELDKENERLEAERDALAKQVETMPEALEAAKAMHDNWNADTRLRFLNRFEALAKGQPADGKG